MKQFTYWLLGERAGRTLVATWNWLWGKPIESGGKIAVEVAQESLQSMQRSVWQLTESVAKISASYRQAKEKYESKSREAKEAETQAALAQRNGNIEAARLAISKAIAIEQLLPQLTQQLAQAEQILQTHREQLSREQQRLETYKVEMQNLKDLAEVNEALAAIAQVNRAIGLEGAQSQFDAAKSAVQERYLHNNSLVELSENPSEKLTADLQEMAIDDEISRRLDQINQSEGVNS